MSKFISIVIADVHWGAMDGNKLYSELELVMDKIKETFKKEKRLDLIVFAGDYFDTKLSLNSKNARLSIRYIKRILDEVSQYNTAVRMVKGTHSHDNDQLDILNNLLIDYNLKIINTVSSEVINNRKILYLPEEYLDDVNEYYMDWFKDTYDYTFGHGMFKEVGFVALTQISETTHNKAPVFDSKLLSSITKYAVIFGHIHITQKIRERIFYTGSFTRYTFGEENDKGFFILKDNGNDCEIGFIKNKEAPLYNTINIEINNNSHISDIMSDLLSINKDLLSNEYNRLRVIFNILPDYQDSNGISILIKEYFSNMKNIKIKIVNGDRSIKDKKLIERVNDLRDRYSFLFNSDIDIDDKISRFIKTNNNIDISKEVISKYINDI